MSQVTTLRRREHNYSTTTLCPAIRHPTHSLFRVLPIEAVIVSRPPHLVHCGRQGTLVLRIRSRTCSAGVSGGFVPSITRSLGIVANARRRRNDVKGLWREALRRERTD